ncbi:MAG TPA: diguanylate cyclase, partial [Candidatus Caenarcaniphilales bacterium]
AQVEAARLAGQVEVAAVDLNDPQTLSWHRPFLDKAVNVQRVSFVALTDSKGKSIVQNSQILAENFPEYPLLEAGGSLAKPQYRRVSVPPGINLGDVPIVKTALAAGRSLAGAELIKGKTLQRLGVAPQAQIGLRPQLTKGLSEAKQPFAEGTYDIDQGKMGLVLMAVHPIRVNNQLVGTAVVGILLNRNYEIVDRIKQSYHVPTVTIFAQDWRVSTNLPYTDGKTRAIGTRVSREVAETVLNRGQTFIGRTNIIGSNYRTSYSPLYDHRQEFKPSQAKPVGILYVGEPEQEVQDFLFRQQLISYSIGGSLLFFVSVLSIPIAASVARPVKDLTRFAQQVATGEGRVRLEAVERQDEVGLLARELNEMAARIEINLEVARQAEAKYRSIFENATEGIFQTTPEGRYLNANPALARIYGYDSPPELITTLTNVEQQLYVERDRRNEFMRLMQEYDAVSEFESQIYRKDGSVIWISENARAIYSASGAILCYEGSVEDITERKGAQEALQQANEKLRVWVSELEQRNRETTLLSEMGELLQACLTVAEAYTVITQCVQPLFPDMPGGLFVMSASKNLVEAVATWGAPVTSEILFAPAECWALRRGQAHLVADTHSGLCCKHLYHLMPGEYCCVPMMAQGDALGVLYLSSLERGRLTAAKQRLAVTVAEQIALALANLQLRETLQNQSIRDPLTGLFNRRYLDESLERELHRAKRNLQSLGIIMLDVDYFKRFNDTFGHEAGDALLRELGLLLQGYIRGADIACRYGGEEFLLLLPEASLDATYQRAEQLRQAVKHLNVQHRRQAVGAVTLSLGVAVFPEHGLTAEVVVRAADVALYRAKAEGRDRIVTALFQANEHKSYLPIRST